MRPESRGRSRHPLDDELCVFADQNAHENITSSARDGGDDLLRPVGHGGCGLNREAALVIPWTTSFVSLPTRTLMKTSPLQRATAATTFCAPSAMVDAA